MIQSARMMDMQRRNFLAAALSSGASLAAGPERPNIVFILFDKCRRDTIGAYGLAPVSTPNLDWIARSGVRFETCYTPQALCCPARASIITGKYPHAHGVRKNVHPLPSKGPNSFEERIPNPFDRPQFDLWDNFPYFLHNAGYQTAHIGKWHLGPGNPGFFDLWRSFNSGLHHWVGEPHRSPYRPDLQTDAGIEFIEHNADRPFFLYQSYYTPHEPYDPPKRFLESLEGKGLEPAGYYGNVASLDWNVGRLVDALRKRGVLDRTLLIVATEHGMTMAARPRPGTEAGGYSSPYDEVSRIPLLLRWPARLPAGTVWRSGVSLVDVMPLILDATGVWGRLGVRYDDRSILADLIAGRDRWRGPLIMQNYSRRPLGGALFEDRAMRTERWKLILRRFERPSTAARGELYDLAADPDEQNNIFSSPAHLETRRHLARELTRWGEQNADPLSKELAAHAL